MKLLRRASVRFYWRHPWQLALAVVGIGLGVAVYVGIGLANDSAARAFDVAAERARGAVTHRLLPVDGALDETLYRDLVLRDGIATAAPVVTLDVGFPGRPERRVPLVGIDPLQLGAMRASSDGSTGSDFARLIVDPGAVLLPAALAAELGAQRDEPLTLVVAGREVPVRVIGFMPEAVSGGADEPPILADIATAQEIAAAPGRLSRIDMTLNAAQAAALAAAKIPNTLLIPTETERSTLRELTTAFRTNLTALGLLALAVGAFLIYGTMAFAVVQRTATIGMLRALGVSRREILTTIAWEAAIVAALATAFGLLLGHWLARGLVGLVLQTVADLSFDAAVSAVAPSPWLYAQGAALGLGATLLAAAKPALDATRIAPSASLRRGVLERGAAIGARRAAVAAVGLLAVGGLALATGSSDLKVAFAGLFAILAAGALLTPLGTIALMNALDRVVGRKLGIAVTLAIRGVGASLSRTGVATAALAVAVATVTGVGLMISSFRVSLDEWLGSTLTADVYVAASDGAGLAAVVDSGAFASLAGVVGMTLTQTRVLPTTGGEIAVRAVRPGTRGWGLTIVAGDASDAIARLLRGSAVIASERLLFARGLRVGDEIELPSPAGVQRVAIGGAFRDFNTGTPAVVMALERYRRDWHDRALSGVGLEVAAGVEAATVAAAAQALGRGFRVRSTAAIEELSLAVFDRTFKVTEVLRALAGIVAFLGILSALLAIELERARELSVLRTLGLTPGGLTTTLLTQTGLLGLAAGLAAVPIGGALAALLVHVINRRSFGWSMELVVDVGGLAGGLSLAVVAALLAGLYPAWRASRIELATGLRED